MTPEQLRQLKGLIRAGAGAEWAAADAAYQRVEQMARRDWAVRVLDAWAEDRFGTEGFHATMRRDVDPGDHTRYQWQCRVAYIEAGRTRIRIEKYGESADAARLAAAEAEAVWPELPESVRAELGERP